jgi:hypothetical protein
VINLVDVGTSAGLNLYFDKFPVRTRDDDNPLTLVCRDMNPGLTVRWPCRTS